MSTKLKNCNKQELLKLYRKDPIDVLILDADGEKVFEGRAEWCATRLITSRKVPTSGIKSLFGSSIKTVELIEYGIRYSGQKNPDLYGAYKNADNPNDETLLPNPLIIMDDGTMCFDNGMTALVFIPGGKLTLTKAKKMAGTASFSHWGDPNPLTSDDKQIMEGYEKLGWNVEYQGVDDHCPYFEISRKFTNVSKALIDAGLAKLDRFEFHISERYYLQCEDDYQGQYDIELMDKRG